MTRSGHVDTFARDNLPPRDQWPEFRFDLPELRYPERMNCATELLDRWVAAGQGDRPCLISPAETLSYAQFAGRVNRIANVLTRDLGLVPGNRVLLRGPNNLMMVVAYFAVLKAGGVVVATMPLLRAKELAYPLTKAKIALALCDARLADEVQEGPVSEVGGLDAGAGRFAADVPRGQRPQLLVDQREEAAGRGGLPSGEVAQDPGEGFRWGRRHLVEPQRIIRATGAAGLQRGIRCRARGRTARGGVGRGPPVTGLGDS